jgi:hypothetical protein
LAFQVTGGHPYAFTYGTIDGLGYGGGVDVVGEGNGYGYDEGSSEGYSTDYPRGYIMLWHRELSPPYEVPHERLLPPHAVRWLVTPVS